MTVGLLIITHNEIGAELLRSASGMLGLCPLGSRTLRVSPDNDPEHLARIGNDLLKELDQGKGVLVLTDAYGSTPANVANWLHNGNQVRVVAGINLPMLIRILNYPHLGLDELADKAVSGGRDGILLCRPEAGDSGGA